jgi:hypothetical protein
MLGSTFHDDVDFAWENNKEDSPTSTSKTNSGSGEVENKVSAGEEEEP